MPLRSSILAIAGASLLLACKSDLPTIPERGHAVVLGTVTRSSGSPFSSTALVVECAGTSSESVTTDATGQYTVGLSAPKPGPIRCVFAVPNVTAARIRVDTVIAFSPAGFPPFQRIDLREVVTP